MQRRHTWRATARRGEHDWPLPSTADLARDAVLVGHRSRHARGQTTLRVADSRVRPVARESADAEHAAAQRLGRRCARTRVIFAPGPPGGHSDITSSANPAQIYNVSERARVRRRLRRASPTSARGVPPPPSMHARVCPCVAECDARQAREGKHAQSTIRAALEPALRPQSRAEPRTNLSLLSPRRKLGATGGRGPMRPLHWRTSPALCAPRIIVTRSMVLSSSLIRPQPAWSSRRSPKLPQ